MPDERTTPPYPVGPDEEPTDFAAMVEVTRGTWTSRWSRDRPDLDTPWSSTVNPGARETWWGVIDGASEVIRVR